MDKQFYVEVVNLTIGKMYSLPTLYTDRTEACVCGQNYVRDRQQENYDDVFYRVLLAKDGKVAEPSYFTVVEDEDEDEEEEEMPTCGNCDGDCQFCPTNYDVEEEEDEDSEEPSSVSLAEILSVFNAIRPNY